MTPFDSRKTLEKSRPKLRAVLYARVSSKEQEREGFSIPAQLKLMKEYAANAGFIIEREYVDVETAKQSGRSSFNEMVTYLRRHQSIRTLLVEKTDRLYRNLKDWVTIDELDVEIHFVKEGDVLSADSRSSEKFMHGIKVLMAKNYIDNLSEETKKGMTEKAAQGIWPSVAPLGYVNVEGANGKRVIEVDPETASMVVRIFEWYSSGKYSIRELGKKARAAGFTHKRSGRPLPTSSIQTMLRNRIYTGAFEWNGQLYDGVHDPIVPYEEWERVQGILDGRRASKEKSMPHRYTFSGLVKCGHCGCALVGEIKKGKYIYYHCTGNKGKCDEPYTRQEVLEQEFERGLKRLTFDDTIFDWMREALIESFADEKRDFTASMEKFTQERDRLQRRIDNMYVDKLDGRVDDEFYNRMRFKWRREQERCLKDIERLQNADAAYMEDGIQLLRLAKDAHRLFRERPPQDQSKMLKLLCSNSSWRDGKLSLTFSQPFDLIEEKVVQTEQAQNAGIGDSARFEIWLPGSDSNQRPSG